MIRAFYLKTLSILAVLVAPAAGFASPAEVVVRLRPVVELESKGADVTLGDLVVARGLDEKLIEALRSVRLADAPAGGESRTFTSLGIGEAFASRAHGIEKALGVSIALDCPSRVVVSRKSFKFQKANVEEVLRSQFASACADCEIEISNLALPAVPKTIPSHAPWKVRTRGEIPKGSFSVPVEIGEEGATRSFWITGSIAVFKQAPVATRAIGAGERIQPEDFIVQKKDVTFATDSIATPPDLGASIAGRSIAAGSVIWRGSLRREAAIKFGDVVKVVAGTEEWQVSIEGVAQSAASVGDPVKVKIPRTQKVISGLVKDKGWVEVR